LPDPDALANTLRGPLTKAVKQPGATAWMPGQQVLEIVDEHD